MGLVQAPAGSDDGFRNRLGKYVSLAGSIRVRDTVWHNVAGHSICKAREVKIRCQA